MPRYFFHLHNDFDVYDDEGQDLADVEAARQRAIKYAVDMTAVSVLESRKVNLHHRIEVADLTGAIIFAVKFGDVVTVQT